MIEDVSQSAIYNSTGIMGDDDDASKIKDLPLSS